MTPEDDINGYEQEIPEDSLLSDLPTMKREFRPDSEAPPVNREQLKALWAKEITDHGLHEQLIQNVLRYRTWFYALNEVVLEDVRRNQG